MSFPEVLVIRDQSNNVSRDGLRVKCGPHERFVCWADMYDAANWDGGIRDLVLEAHRDILWTIEQYKDV